MKRDIDEIKKINCKYEGGICDSTVVRCKGSGKAFAIIGIFWITVLKFKDLKEMFLMVLHVYIAYICIDLYRHSIIT